MESNHAPTAVSERRLPSRPVVDACCADRKSASAEFRMRAEIPRVRRQHSVAATWGVARESHPAPRIHSPRARYKPCDAVSPGGVEPPSPAVGARRSSVELRRGALSTGIEPASPGRQPGRMSQTRPRACRKYPERESNPRLRCERPASSTARRPGHDCSSHSGVSPRGTRPEGIVLSTDPKGRMRLAARGARSRAPPGGSSGPESEAATAGVEPAFSGYNRTSCR